MPGGFLECFANNGLDQILAGFEMTGRLINNQFAADAFFDKQKPVMALCDSGDSNVRFPDHGGSIAGYSPRISNALRRASQFGKEPAYTLCNPRKPRAGNGDSRRRVCKTSCVASPLQFCLRLVRFMRALTRAPFAMPRR